MLPLSLKKGWRTKDQSTVWLKAAIVGGVAGGLALFSLEVSIYILCTVFSLLSDARPIDRWAHLADQALYTAKCQGRGVLVVRAPERAASTLCGSAL